MARPRAQQPAIGLRGSPRPRWRLISGQAFRLRASSSCRRDARCCAARKRRPPPRRLPSQLRRRRRAAGRSVDCRARPIYRPFRAIFGMSAHAPLHVPGALQGAGFSASGRAQNFSARSAGFARPPPPLYRRACRCARRAHTTIHHAAASKRRASTLFGRELFSMPPPFFSSKRQQIPV